MRKGRSFFAGCAIFIASMIVIFATGAFGAPFNPPPAPPPPPPPPPPALISSTAVGPVGVAQAYANKFEVDVASSRIEWDGNSPYLVSSSFDQVKTVFQAGAFGRWKTLSRLQHSEDYIIITASETLPRDLFADWQSITSLQVPERIIVLPGTRILVYDSQGWRAGSVDDIKENFSLLLAIPSAQGFIAIEISIP